MKIRWALLISLLTSCNTVAPPPPGAVVVAGYATSENGRLQLLDDSSEAHSQLVVQPGENTFSIQAESAPEFPQRLEAPENYLCVERSTHQMSALMLPDSIYRLSLDRMGACQFRIVAVRQLSPDGPAGTIIPSKSTQLGCERRCRFYGPFRLESEW
jgi:hypothetical protein